jgi:hypothetical protein
MAWSCRKIARWARSSKKAKPTARLRFGCPIWRLIWGTYVRQPSRALEGRMPRFSAFSMNRSGTPGNAIRPGHTGVHYATRVLASTITVAVSTAPLRAAKVRDRMDSLVIEPTKVEGGAVGSCAMGAAGYQLSG